EVEQIAELPKFGKVDELPARRRPDDRFRRFGKLRHARLFYAPIFDCKRHDRDLNCIPSAKRIEWPFPKWGQHEAKTGYLRSDRLCHARVFHVPRSVARLQVV